MKKFHCQSLVSFRAEGALFRVAVQDVVEPIVEAIDPVTTGLSSYDPGKVAEAANMPTSDREVSSFVSLAKSSCASKLTGLTLEQAAALIRAPDTRSEARLCGVLSWNTCDFRRGSGHVQGTRQLSTFLNVQSRRPGCTRKKKTVSLPHKRRTRRHEQ